MLERVFPYILQMSFFSSAMFILLYLFHFRNVKNHGFSYGWLYAELKLLLFFWVFPFLSCVSWIYREFPALFSPFLVFLPVKVNKITPVDTLIKEEWIPPSTVTEMTAPTSPIVPIIESIPVETVDSFSLLSLLSYLPLLWGICVGILSVKYLFHWISWRKLVKTARPVDESLKAIFQKECESLHMKQQISLLSWDLLDTPVLVGLFHKKIVLPEKEWDESHYTIIFSHELSHVKGKDLWWNALLQLATLLHFFNPLVHLFARKFREVMEFSCDERVGKTLDFQEKKEYCHSLLESASVHILEKNIYGLGFSNSKMNIERRMIAMIHPTNMKKSTKLCSILLISTLLLGATAPFAIESGKNALLAKEVETALLEVEGLTEIQASVHHNGRVFLSYTDTSNTHPEETPYKEKIIHQLVAEICDVEVLDVWSLGLTGRQANKSLDELLESITKIAPQNQFFYSSNDWATLLEGVERGNITMLDSTEEEMDFWEIYSGLDRTPIVATTQYLGADYEMPYEMRTKIYQDYNDFGSGTMDTQVVLISADSDEYFFEVTFDHRETGDFMVSVDGGETWTVEDKEEYALYQMARHEELSGTPSELSQEELDFEAWIQSLENPPTGFSISYPQDKYNDIDLLMSGEVVLPAMSDEIRRNLYQSYNDFGTGELKSVWVEVDALTGEGYFQSEMTYGDSGKRMISVDGGVNWSE